MTNESFSFEEAAGAPSQTQAGGFSFEEAFGQPSQATPGFIPTIKRTGGQMLTTAATSLEDVTGPNAVTRAVHDAGQGIIDRNPAGIRSLRDLVDSPWLAVKESVGQFAPQIAAAAVGGVAGAKAGAALGGVAGPAGAAAGGAIGGVAGSLLPIFTQEYGGIRQEQKESGQEDKGRALMAAIPATALERVGMGKALKVLKGVPGGAAGTVLKEAGKGVLKEGATEGAQNVIEQWGAFKDPTTGENLDDTALAAAMGGIGGGVMGGASGAVDGVRRHAQERAQAQAEQQASQNAEAAAADAQAKADALVPPWTTEAGATDPAADVSAGLPDVRAYGPLIEQAIKPELQERFRNLLDSATSAELSQEQRDAAADELHSVFSPERLEQRRQLDAGTDFTTTPGAAAPRDGGVDFTRDVDTSGLSLEDPAEAERARAATIDYQPGDTTPQWGTAPGAAPERQGMDMPGPGFGTEGLALEPDPRTPSERTGIDPGAGPLSRNVAAALDRGDVQEAQFMGASGRELQVRRSGPGVMNESNVIDVQGRVIEDRALGMAQGTATRAAGQLPMAAETPAPINPTGEPLRLDMAHALRNQARDAGVLAAVVRHASGRGYDVVPQLPAPATQAAPPVVATPTGAPFATRAAAQAELQRQQLTSTHDVAPAGGDESLGFVLQDRSLNTAPAQQQQAPAAIDAVAQRAPNWRTNAMQANRVARAMGLDTKGKRLSQVVAEIDAHDAAAAQVPVKQETRASAGAAPVRQGGGQEAAGDLRALAAQFRERHQQTGQDTDRTFAAVIDQFAGEVEQGKRTRASFAEAEKRYREMLGQATHKDPGQPAEAATPAVVGQSMAKAAGNQEASPAQMRNWLFGEIDKAIASAPEVATGFLTFDVPGDGSFKVVNSTAKLREFRKRVAASPGFRQERGGQPQGVEDGAHKGSASTVEAIKNMLANGDIQAAVEYAGAKGVEFHLVPPQLKVSPNGGKARHIPASVKSTPAGVAEGLTQLESESIHQWLQAEQQRASTTVPSTKNATETVAAGASGQQPAGAPQQHRPPAQRRLLGMGQNSSSAQSLQAQDAIEKVANPAAETPSDASAAEQRPITKIQDFGEELRGARKMLYAEAYADGMAKAKELSTTSHPLSKTWPEPDYQKLFEGGAPAKAVSLARALREAVPAKPQSSWKLKGWAAKVEALRGFAEDVLSGRLDTKTVEGSMERSGLRGVPNKAALYEAMGHERSLKGIELSAGQYSMYGGVRYDPPRTIWTVSREAKGSTFGNWPRELAKGDTREQAIAAFKQRAAELLAEEQAPARGASFEIYSKRAGGAREFFIGKKIGRNVAELKAGFADLKAARQYKAEHQAELEDLLAKYKAVPPVRNAQNAPRIGQDYRKGADVTPAQFQETFGFRGVQFGNYVEGSRRQQDLNQAYDGLMDLAGVLNLPPRALSLGGRLGLAFGARGAGGVDAAAAHYERGEVVINLTKKQGAGSLAHEWWHALDNYFSRQRGDAGSYMSEDARRGDGVREEMRAAFREVVSAIQRTGMQERSRKLDERRTKEYWSTKTEMSARAFESYVIAKLQDQNAGNDYLANVVGHAVFALEGAYPYPTAGEMAPIREAFDGFFRAVETREADDGTTVLYSTSSEAPPARGLSVEQAQKAVQQALAGFMSPPPIDIVLRGSDLGPGTPDGVMGAAIPSEGRIVIVAAAHRNVDAVVETLFHEMFHLGIRNVLPASDYVQAMLDLAKRDSRVQEYANRWKKDSADAPQQLQVLRDLGHTGSDLTAWYEALAIEEGLAVVAEELRAQKQAGTRLGLRVRALAGWLANVAERMGMQRLADSIRKMTYNEAERFVMRAIEHAGRAPLAQGVGPDNVSRYRTQGSNAMAQRVGDALAGLTVTDLRQQAAFKAADLRPLGLQFLGRRQLVDVYGGMLPELRAYSDLMARMDADKNEAGAGADQLATDWAKLPDERQLAELMHDATLAQMDPARDYVDGDNRVKYGELHRRFEALSPAARDVYTRARDTYRQHMRDVRAAIKERIERAEMSSERRAAMLKRLDDEFFGHIKGVYFPLARFGQYVVVVKGADGKVANVSRAETMAEADTMRRQLLAAFPQAEGFTVGKVLKAKDFVAERDSVGRGFMEQLYGVLDKQGMAPQQRAELEDALGQLYLSSLPDLSWAKHGIHRKGTPGFSQDARRAFAQNVFHGASYLAKLRYGDQLQDQLAEMQKRVDAGASDGGFDSVKAQQVVDEMAKRHDAAMNPKTNALSTALTSLGFMFHLGLSPASAMVNLTQTALVAYPVMGARWGFSKASAALLKASQEAVRGKNDITASLNQDEKAAFEEAVRSGVVDVTMAHDLAGIAQGEDRSVSYKLRPVMRAASFLFHHAEKFNRQVTFVAAFRLAREAGADPKSAYQQAVQATYDGHFDYSANNRPRVMQGNVARVLLLFKQYGQNMVYTLARSAQQSLKGATPEERTQARKALAGLLTMHAMAAGVLGLPMVTTLLSAASMLGGDDDEPWDAQVALQNLLADTFGQKPAEVLSHGLSRLTPWDISGRVGLDKLIFPDVQEGLEGQRLGESAMAAALGPVAAIGINALKGLQEMSEGRYQRGLETMAPSVLRGPLKALRYETEGVKDKTGIVVQDEVGAAALLGQAAGFSPSSVRNAYEGKAAIVGHDRALQARRSALVEQFAMAAMAGDEEGKSEAREAIARFNEKNPGRRIQPMQLAQSVHQREKRIREAKEGVYLPAKRRDVLEQGRFAVGE